MLVIFRWNGDYFRTKNSRVIYVLHHDERIVLVDNHVLAIVPINLVGLALFNEDEACKQERPIIDAI